MLEFYTEEFTDRPELYFSADLVKRFCLKHRLFSCQEIAEFTGIENVDDDFLEVMKSEV